MIDAGLAFPRDEHLGVDLLLLWGTGYALDLRYFEAPSLAAIRSVQVNELRNETFYARVVLSVDGRQLDIDARPSDAIALAVRAKVPRHCEQHIRPVAGGGKHGGKPMNNMPTSGTLLFVVFPPAMESPAGVSTQPLAVKLCPGAAGTS